MRLLKILHIEDREEDMELFRRACEAAELPATFFSVGDGIEAIRYLNGEEPFGDRGKFPLPDLIVLDLQMPGMGGMEFLRWIRKEPRFLQLPVLIFTISEEVDDKIRALAEGATGYFVKPQEFETLVRLAESFRNL